MLKRACEHQLAIIIIPQVHCLFMQLLSNYATLNDLS